MKQRVIVVLALTLALPFAASAQHTAQPQNEEAAARAAAERTGALWDALVRGNRDFAAGRVTLSEITARRTELVGHQRPGVTVLGCSDSRVPPELVFNQSLGDLFVIRTAGNVADEFGLASVEYAVAHGFTNLIVVLGHESCGAVAAALQQDDPATPSLRALVERIRMSFVGLPWKPEEPATMRRAIEMNARSAAASLVAQSSVIRDAESNGTLRVVPAYYEFSTGQVHRLE